ncbi:MAG TPA: S8 family serine peptidase [Candidatus Saccharimonadales bacterium]|nr:S8 family serine peptidase [Candidatus Saccharimonadales bacterium]
MRRLALILLSAALAAGLRPALGAELKLDAGLNALRVAGPIQPARAARALGAQPPAAGAAERIPCFIRGRVSRLELLAMGIPVGAQAGGVVTAQLTWDDVERVSMLPGVEMIQLAHRARLMLDSSRVAIHANAVQGGTPPNYTGITGKGVVVGIVDTGIDWTHADFQDKNGLNRILFIWDQTGAGPSPPAFGYGTEWNQSAIQAGSCTENDADGHGTHVAGTAAGSGRATGNGKANYHYVGIAPEADIVFVKLDASFAWNFVIDGVDYIFQKADALGKSAVVNLSLGSDFGPHDGTDPTEVALNGLCGPGHIVCVAAGNSGADRIHAEADVTQGNSASVTFQVPSYTPAAGAGNDAYFIDAYYGGTDSISVKVMAPNGWQSATVVTRQTVYQADATASQGRVLIDNASGGLVSNGQHNLYIQVWDYSQFAPPAAGLWTVTLTGAHIHGTGHTDLWMADPQLGTTWPAVPFQTGYVHSKEVATPSTAESTLCVAAFATKNQWNGPDGTNWHYSSMPTLGDIASFSSRGPTADNRLRPTIAAPGFGVAAALSYLTVGTVGGSMVEDSVHFIDQGTSMATPHVTGVAALVLQNHAGLPPSRVKAAIESTATRDAFTGAAPGPTWGYGKLNANAVNSNTPVLMFALEGLETERGLEVSWAVAEGIHFEGFRVLRAAAASGPWTDLTPAPLPAEARSYVDTPRPGVWYYQVQGLRQGDTQVLGPLRTEVTGTSRLTLRLAAPLPNPTAGSTLLSFVVPGPRSVEVELAVYDVVGRRVAALYSGAALPGRHDVRWDGSAAGGRRASPGLYLVRLQALGRTLVRKLALVR